MPDASFLPPDEEWANVPEEDIEDATTATRKILNNGYRGPGVKTYLDRRRELSIDNTTAFRTVRRIPHPTGAPTPRLGNSYEFYKNLETFSGYWVDTSLPKETTLSSDATKINSEDETEIPKEAEDTIPLHQQTHIRTGTGSQLPHEYRQALTSSFVKLITYDFSCNVTYPRIEPRLHIHPPKSQSSSSPSYFSAAGVTMAYRTPIERNAARACFIEGPVAALSSRSNTSFTTPFDSNLDLAREVATILLTAQQRNREGKEENHFGEGKWWTTVPRWGGGKGGAIGKEIDTSAPIPSPTPRSSRGDKVKDKDKSLLTDIKNKITSINSLPSLQSVQPGSFLQIPTPERRPPQKKPRTARVGGQSQLYENYRRMIPPTSNWDKKTKYLAIGKPGGLQGNSDEIFLISVVNHHVSIVRGRVGMDILRALNGEENIGGKEGIMERTTIWRTRWYDFFLAEDRVEAMRIIWGALAWIMRAEKYENEKYDGGADATGAAGEGEMEVDN